MKLNDAQKEAINHVNGPLLILAGAGSGKTRVLTERIAHLITEVGVAPYNILAVTFTNKAAKEMKERIAKRIGDDAVKNLWVGTFHSICSKILRIESNYLGRNSNFVIYDSADQNKIISECLKKANLDEKTYTPSKVISSISRAKSSGITSEGYAAMHLSYGEQKISDIYLMYEDILRKNNAMDFDDLLLYVVRLFKDSPERLSHYQKKFRYILVDEYQDTNHVQYELIKSLGSMYRNVCVVGDVDQSIYSFRNADFKIILNFQQDYPEARLIKPEQNYRSTGNILALSNEIIKNNQSRFAKVLTTENPRGEKIKVYEAQDDGEEVRYVIREIYRLIENARYDYQDFAILYRTNAQSRILEEYFVRNNIPHQLIGGFRFFERKEVKDTISYLKAIFNPHDSISLQRIINTPKRSIGNTTVEKLLNLADMYNLSFWDVLNFETFENISPATQKAIRDFVAMMRNLIESSNTVSVSRLIRMILDDSGLLKELEKEDEKQGFERSRVENALQLVNSAVDFEVNSDDVTLDAYLSYISLVSDADSLENQDRNVKLMTVHTAKGLEFPVVFIVGIAEGIFPHANSSLKNSELEEERRLMYVAITRAREKLYMTFPRRRFQYGNVQNLIPSRFIMECPPDLISGYTPNNEVYDRMFEDQQDSFERKRQFQESGFQKPEKNFQAAESWSDYENYDPFEENANTTFKKKGAVSGDDYSYNLKKSIKKLDPLAIQASLESRYTKNNTTETTEEEEQEFAEGEKIRTIKFGVGKITKVLKNDQKTLLFVNFDNHPGNKIIDPKLTAIDKL